MSPLKLLTCPGASAHLPLPSLSLYSPPHLQKRKRGSSLRKVWSIELWNMCNLRFCESAATAWIMTANKVWYCLNFRCHALVAVQGVEQRPQTIGNFNQVLVQLRHIPLTLTLESSSSNASVRPWRSSWDSNTSAASEYCNTIVPKKYFSLYLFIRHQTCEFRKKFFSLSGPRIL